MQENGADSGRFVISDDAVIFDPFGNPRINPMLMSSGYRPEHGAHIEQSAFCASCHTLYTPALDPESGLPSGPGSGLPSADKGFLEQGTYLEWQNSSYKTREISCQDCHMPVPTDSYRTRISTRSPTLPEREPYAQHILAGGNAHLLEILREYRSELGIDASTFVQGFTDQYESHRDFIYHPSQVAIYETVLGDINGNN
jgi:hypothetical protein